jgi:hypothetical protein
MEWLVFHTTCSDGHTYSYDKFIPFQYSSKKDAEDLLLDFADQLLKKYIMAFNSDEWNEYYDWLKNNEFFNSWFDLSFNDFWYHKEQNFSFHGKLKMEDIGMDFPEIFTLQEWAEAKEEKVKYLQKVI